MTLHSEPTRRDIRLARDRRSSGFGRHGFAFSFLGFAILSIFANLQSWIHGLSTYLPSGYRPDISQSVWFLGWFPHAISHFQDPFVTTWINAPVGVNLVRLTSAPALSILAWPFTAMGGSVFTYNLLVSLNLFVSASAMFILAKRWVPSVSACFFAGALYGFGPFMVAQGSVHLFLTFAAAFPLLLLLADELFRRQRMSSALVGIAIAVLVDIELFTSSELLTDFVILAGIGLVILWFVDRRVLASARDYALRAARWSLVGLPAVLVYLAYYFHGGVVSAYHDPAALRDLSGTLAGTVIPSHNQWLSLGLGSWADHLVAVNPAANTYGTNTFENGIYLGVPLIALFVLSLKLVWPQRRGKVIAILAVCSWVLSLGPSLRVAGLNGYLPLPFAVFAHLPIVNNLIAARFSLFTVLFVGLTIALAVDHHLFTSESSLRGTKAVVIRLLGIAAVLSLIPAFPYNASPTHTPQWFTSSAQTSVKPDSVLLTYPLSHDGLGQPMGWQAAARYQFKLVGGEAGPQTTSFGAIGASSQACGQVADPQNFPTSWLLGVRSQLRAWHITTIVVSATLDGAPTPGLSCALTWYQKVTGRHGHLSQGVYVWRIS